MTQGPGTLSSPFMPDEDDDRWPDPANGSTGTSQADELYKAKLAHIKALRDAEIATHTADTAAAVAVEKAFLDSVLEVSRARVDRARAGAETEIGRASCRERV